MQIWIDSIARHGPVTCNEKPALPKPHTHILTYKQTKLGQNIFVYFSLFQIIIIIFTFKQINRNLYMKYESCARHHEDNAFICLFAFLFVVWCALERKTMPTPKHVITYASFVQCVRNRKWKWEKKKCVREKRWRCGDHNEENGTKTSERKIV